MLTRRLPCVCASMPLRRRAFAAIIDALMATVAPLRAVRRCCCATPERCGADRCSHVAADRARRCRCRYMPRHDAASRALAAPPPRRVYAPRRAAAASQRRTIYAAICRFFTPPFAPFTAVRAAAAA